MNRRAFVKSAALLSLASRNLAAEAAHSKQKSRLPQQLTVHAVYHGTPSDERKARENNAKLVELFADFERNGVRQVATEIPPYQQIGDLEQKIYALQMEIEARKRGVALVRIDNSNGQVALSIIESFFKKLGELEQKGNAGNIRKEMWAKTEKVWAAELKDNPVNQIIKAALPHITAAINAGHSFADLSRAIGYFRSQLMFEKAKAHQHAIVGSLHAHEMPVKLTQIKSINVVIPPKETINELKLRKQAHEKTGGHVNKIWRAISTHPQSKQEIVSPGRRLGEQIGGLMDSPEVAPYLPEVKNNKLLSF